MIWRYEHLILHPSFKNEYTHTYTLQEDVSYAWGWLPRAEPFFYEFKEWSVTVEYFFEIEKHSYYLLVCQGRSFERLYYFLLSNIHSIIQS